MSNNGNEYVHFIVSEFQSIRVHLIHVLLNVNYTNSDNYLACIAIKITCMYIYYSKTDMF